VERSLAKEPEHRHADAAAMAVAIEDASKYVAA
jgi:hypothetical protein